MVRAVWGRIALIILSFNLETVKSPGDTVKNRITLITLRDRVPIRLPSVSIILFRISPRESFDYTFRT